LHDLLDVLDPNVVGWVDLGDLNAPLPSRPQGARDVAKSALALFGPKSAARLVLAEINGKTGYVVALGGRPLVVLAFKVAEERITAIYVIADRAKWRHVRTGYEGDSS
jgi:RNA polymerase sigma-70 factor (ECF subfamily)